MTMEVWRALQDGKPEKDGKVVFEGGSELYTHKDKAGRLMWTLENQLTGPEDNGPFPVFKDAWKVISGGLLSESNGLIVIGAKLFRLAAVVTEDGNQAAAYEPSAYGPKQMPCEVLLPRLSMKLWKAMKVGLWEDGGWQVYKGGPVAHLHLHKDRVTDEEEWVLRPEDTKLGGPPAFRMPRDDWNRISCGALAEEMGLIEKDGLLLRVIAVSAGDHSAAMTYAPAFQRDRRWPSPPKPKPKPKKKVALK